MSIHRLVPRNFGAAGVLGLAIAAASVAACGAAKSDEPQHPVASAEVHKGSVAETTEGSALYVANCAGCHGPTGRGTSEVPAVVGDDALPQNPGPKSKVRHTQFNTAQDIFEFVRTTMPASKPGSLSDDSYYAIVTFALKLNGVDLQGKKVDPVTAPTIRLPKK